MALDRAREQLREQERAASKRCAGATADRRSDSHDADEMASRPSEGVDLAMRTLDLVWAWWDYRCRVTELNRVETILRDFPHVVFHLRDAFDLGPDGLGTDLAYARMNRRGDLLSLATTARRIDAAMSEWHLVVTRSQKQRGTPLTLPRKKAGPGLSHCSEPSMRHQ